MRVSNVLLPCIVAMGLATPAHAEIYQSKDAQGNTVFSDTPSQGAEEIKMPHTNSADPVIESPRPPPQEDKPARQNTSATPANSRATDGDTDDDDNVLYGGSDDYEDLAEKRAIERRRDGDGAQPIGDRPVVEPHRKVSRPAARVRGRR